MVSVEVKLYFALAPFTGWNTQKTIKYGEETKEARRRVESTRRIFENENGSLGLRYAALWLLLSPEPAAWKLTQPGGGSSTAPPCLLKFSVVKTFDKSLSLETTTMTTTNQERRVESLREPSYRTSWRAPGPPQIRSQRPRRKYKDPPVAIRETKQVFKEPIRNSS